MGQTTSSCTRRLAWACPAMSSQATLLLALPSRISLHTISRIWGSSFCNASGSSPSGPAPSHAIELSYHPQPHGVNSVCLDSSSVVGSVHQVHPPPETLQDLIVRTATCDTLGPS